MGGVRVSTLGGLLAGASSVVAGAGYALTPATGRPGVRFGAFGDAWVEPAAGVLGVLGGFAIIAAVTAAASGNRVARPVAAALLAVLAAAAAGGIWIWYRADPPLPPSWGWLRIPEGLGVAGVLTWLAGALRRRIPRV